MEISKILSLSTAHITSHANTFLTLSENTSLPVRWASHEYGYIFFLLTDNLLKKNRDTIEFKSLRQTYKDLRIDELVDIFVFAVDNGCTHVDIDRDAQIIYDLKTFEW